MLLIVAKYLIPKGYRGLTIFPFVLLKFQKDKANEVLINHEKIHFRQQLELLILPFYIWYFLEYILRFIQYRNTNLAYRNICFEREAYINETDLNYLNKRPVWSWRHFLKS